MRGLKFAAGLISLMVVTALAGLALVAVVLPLVLGSERVVLTSGSMEPLIDPGDFVHALLARYDSGAGIGWHKDRDVFEKVVGVSLNTPATLRFRQRTAAGFRRAELAVEPRSAYLLSGEARWDWEHRITPGDQLRFSITVRTLSDKGRRIAAA